VPVSGQAKQASECPGPPKKPQYPDTGHIGNFPREHPTGRRKPGKYGVTSCGVCGIEIVKKSSNTKFCTGLACTRERWARAARQLRAGGAK
jgi:hypothetical protein